ncbi:MAG: hypothetical protein ACK4F9_06235, partial [Brevinematia bacterium]
FYTTMKIVMKAKKLIYIFGLSISFFLFFLPTKPFCEEGEVIGIFGKTYPIKEKDAYEEILEKVKTSKLNEKLISIKKNLSKHYIVNFELAKAKKDETRVIKLSYKLPFNIKDRIGKTIYPAGYTFNPLDYVKIPFYLVFINATSKEELSWLKSSGLIERWDSVFIITKGNIYDVSNSIGRQVFAADKNILNYFSIKRTPSIVYQVDNYLIVKEVGVYASK